MSNTLHESMTTNSGDDISPANREVNNRQEASVNNVPFNRNVEDSQGSDAHSRTRYGRIVQKPDRLTLNHIIFINITHILISSLLFLFC